MNFTIPSRFMEQIGKYYRLYFSYHPLLSRIRNLEHKAVVLGRPVADIRIFGTGS